MQTRSLCKDHFLDGSDVKGFGQQTNVLLDPHLQIDWIKTDGRERTRRNLGMPGEASDPPDRALVRDHLVFKLRNDTRGHSQIGGKTVLLPRSPVVDRCEHAREPWRLRRLAEPQRATQTTIRAGPVGPRGDLYAAGIP
jgi:hypothetical protein